MSSARPGGWAETVVRRPVTVLTLVLAVAVFGTLAAERLPSELLPDLSYPTLTVQTTYPDAAPTSVEQFVTKPIEEAVGVIPGVRELRSVSRASRSEVVLEFGWGQNMDLAALDVREKLGLAELPEEVEPPRVLRYDPALEPMLRLALRGEGRDLDELFALAERWLEPRLEAVPGVAAVKLRGGLVAEIQIEADPDALAARGLTLADLERALGREDVNLPGGTLRDRGSVFLVRTLHAWEDLDAIRQTVLREGAPAASGQPSAADAAFDPTKPVRLADVAEVRRGAREREEVSLLDGAEVLELALYREGSANLLGAATAAHAELDRLRERLPQGLELVVLSDPSRAIARAVTDVWSAALIGGLLAVLVVYFFLRDLPSTGIVALTIPVSVVATFLPMLQAQVTLNVMSLGGLALGVGMLVDNAIVVLEAIDRRRREEGLSRRAAAAAGTRDVAGAVTAATLTTVSVFFPIVFVEGIAGQLFRDLAVTVCYSLVASLVASLTLIPALAGLDPDEVFAQATGFARRGEGEEDAGLVLGPLRLLPVGEGRAARAIGALLLPARIVVGLALLLLGALAFGLAWAFHLLTWPAARALEGLGAAYPSVLRAAIRGRALVIPLTVALFLGALSLLPGLPTTLVPSLAQGQLAYRLRLPEGTPLARTQEVLEQLCRPLQGDPRFQRVFAVAGSLPSTASGRPTQGENLGRLDVVLAEGADAAAEAEARERVRQVLAAVPTLVAESVEAQGFSLAPPVEVRVFADELRDLEAATAAITSQLARLPELSDLGATLEPGNPELRVHLLRERAAQLGVSAEAVATALRRQVRGVVVGRYREEEKRLEVRLRAAEEHRERLDAVARLRVRLSSGEVVPLGAVAEVVVERGPAAIHHASGARVARVQARHEGRDLGETLDRVRGLLASQQLPAGAVAELAGQDQELAASFASLRLALLLAVFLVFVVMAAQFESLRHPLVILLSVPLGAVGVIAILWLTGAALSVLVLIGAVMLAGIVVNNAIVLVDAVNRRRRAGEELDEALLGGGRERLRPILMTTTTTVLALVPMALGWGAGDELRGPLAHTVIGGLLGATVLTLVVIPCVYRVLAGPELGPEAEPETETETEPGPEPGPGPGPGTGTGTGTGTETGTGTGTGAA